jgi:copper chaperone CopZ
MKIQLLTFPDCPNAARARDALREAMRAVHVHTVEEIDIGREDTPAELRAWGSPTILIDGVDVTGAKPSHGDIGCRLYADGAPTVAQIRAVLHRTQGSRGAVHVIHWLPKRAERAEVPVIAAVIAAVAASACCVLPILFALVGLSGVGVAAALTPYRPYFLVATGLALALGLWLAYRPSPPDGCGCEQRRWTRVGLWLGVVLAAGIAVYPWLFAGDASAVGTPTRGVTEVRLHIDGMDCRACGKTIARKLATVHGVVTAEVDYDAKLAIVTHDGTHDPTHDLLDAVEDLGYHGSRR